MSTADQAWQEYNDGYERASTRANGIPIRLGEIPEAAFMAGYRRALEDAAEVVKSRFEHGRLTTDECELVETWLRDRAAAVGTKDGDDDHE